MDPSVNHNQVPLCKLNYSTQLMYKFQLYAHTYSFIYMHFIFSVIQTSIATVNFIHII